MNDGCAECVAEAEAAHRPLDRAPTRPCPRHGAPVLPPECATAWRLYQLLCQQRQLIIIERQDCCDVYLNYAAVDLLLRLYVAPDEHAVVFEQLHIIHDVIYGEDA